MLNNRKINELIYEIKILSLSKWMGFNRRWGYVLAIASILCIVIATIYPFDFVVPQNLSLQNIFGKFDRISDLKDYANNIILFIPWGFSLAWILTYHKKIYIGIIIGVIIASFTTSLTVETIQFFLPIRTSNFTDVATNTIGGSIGAFLYWWRVPIINFLRALIFNNRYQLTPKSVGLAFISYFVFIYLLVFGLLISVNLSNWDLDFPLIIGNNITGEHPWQGKINQLHISDRNLSFTEINAAFSEREVFWLKSDNSVASYLFTKKFNHQDADFTNIVNNEPMLIWQEKSFLKSVQSQVDQSDSENIILNNNRWLKSSGSISKITEKLRKNNKFTISAILATNKIEQPDYARILSISGNSYNRNVAIAQNRKNLILCLRTPVTGLSGSQPMLIIPNVFSDLQFHHLIITFDANKLDVYIDNPKNKYTFTFEPEITFLSYFPSVNPLIVNLDDSNIIFYRLGFYSILLIPLGFLGGRLLFFFNHKKIKQLLLLNVVYLLPALLIEQLYATLASQPMRIFNLLLSMTILLSTTLIFKKSGDISRSKQLFTRTGIRRQN